MQVGGRACLGTGTGADAEDGSEVAGSQGEGKPGGEQKGEMGKRELEADAERDHIG